MSPARNYPHILCAATQSLQADKVYCDSTFVVVFVNFYRTTRCHITGGILFKEFLDYHLFKETRIP
jgi:hypothetical protein